MKRVREDEERENHCAEGLRQIFQITHTSFMPIYGYQEILFLPNVIISTMCIQYMAKPTTTNKFPVSEKLVWYVLILWILRENTPWYEIIFEGKKIYKTY